MQLMGEVLGYHAELAPSDMPRMVRGFLLAAVVAGCQRSMDSGPEAVRQVIEAHNANAKRWYANGQVDSLAALFVADVWQLPPNSPPLVGRDSLRRFWATAMTWGRWEFDFTTQDVVVSNSVAVERGRYTLQFTATPRAPIPSVADTGNYVVLWHQEPDGQWRAVWDAPVSIRPLTAPSRQ
jgi:ketosteroid isomerase-like protein